MTGLAGLRVLIVEDEGIVALMLEGLLEELGCVVAASVARLEAGWAALESSTIDLALLDINVAGETSFDLARAMAKRDIPFVFSTGYGAAGLPADLQGQRVLTKPFDRDALHAAATAACARSG